MMLYPLISIIIPVYNVERWIKESLNSALEQTYPNIEYLIIDDCGNDDSIKIIEEIIKCNKGKKLRLIKHSVNKGLSEARNTGLKAALGDYVFFMDSDDQITNNCIEKHFTAIKVNNADFTDANVDIVGKGHNNFSTYIQEECIEKDILMQYFINLHICGWNKLISRRFLLDNNLFFRKGMLYEDMLWTYQLCKAAKKIYDCSI